MLPTITVFGWTFSTYWMMLLIGAIGMGIYVWHHRDVYHFNGVKTVLFTILLTIVGFSGAKLLFVLENLRVALEEGISLGGVSFFGSVFLIPLLMPLIGYLFHLLADETMDICGPCVAIMICCMRLGCYLQGCCGGWELCLGNLCFSWPTQALESIGDFTIFLLLAHWQKDEKRRGQLYPLFMLFYSLMRFGVEFLRDTPKDWMFLSHGQWFALVAIVAATIWLALMRHKNNENNMT